MRIDGIGNVGNVYKSKRATKAYGGSSIAPAKDDVSFSEIAKDLAIAKKAIDNTPDVRMEKVDDLKAQIEAGQYNISASQVANRLLTQSRAI